MRSPTLAWLRKSGSSESRLQPGAGWKKVLADPARQRRAGVCPQVLASQSFEPVEVGNQSRALAQDDDILGSPQ